MCPRAVQTYASSAILAKTTRQVAAALERRHSQVALAPTAGPRFLSLRSLAATELSLP